MWFLLGTISRWVLFAGLLTAIGAVAFKLVVLPRVSAGSEAEGGSFAAERSAARVGLVSAVLVALGASGRLAAEIAVFRDPFESLGSELSLLVLETSWGAAWLGQVVAVGGGAVAFAAAVKGRGVGRGLGWVGACGAVVLLACTPAFSGHAAGAEDFVTAAISADVFHVMAGGTWLGTLAVMALVSRSGLRAGEPVPRARLVGWIVAFSPLALASAAVIGVTGVSEGPVRLPPTVVLELSAGLALLLVTAILVTTPPPAH